MKCAWNELMGVIPQRLREQVDRQGRETMQELRLRIGAPPKLHTAASVSQLQGAVTAQEIGFVVNMASRYSLWAAATSAKGYITARGGHRIGICGEAVFDGREMTGIRTATSLCIRVARDFPGIADKLRQLPGNLLILGPPGSGKTTLLRDLIRKHPGTAVVDERGELFPMAQNEFCFDPGADTDVLTGCPKTVGIDTVLRTMGPSWIAVDEITAESDCDALIRAGWCGVGLLATAHAAGVADLRSRPIYRKLLDSGLFQTAIVMDRSKSWRKERIC